MEILLFEEQYYIFDISSSIVWNYFTIIAIRSWTITYKLLELVYFITVIAYFCQAG